MSGLVSLSRRVARYLMWLACIAMAASFLLVMLGVVSRLVRWDIQGLDAYAGYAIAATAFLALPETFLYGEHIRVTLLLERLSPSIRRGFEWWCLVVGFIAALWLMWYAGRLVWLSHVTHDISSGTDATPLWIPQISMVLGCFGFALAFLSALVQHVYHRPLFISSGDIVRSE